MALTRPSKLISSDISGSFNKSAVSASFAQSSAVTASLRSHVLTSALSGSTTIISGSVKSTGSFGSIYTDKNVNASAFVGDGSSLTGIDIPTAAAISGAAAITAIASTAANQLLTDDGDGTATSEANLTFDGTHLTLGGTSGSIILPAGGGINFAAQTGDAGGMTKELLDDYEEGTWTPAFTFGSGEEEITIYTANYTKIGRVVQIDAFVKFANVGSPSGTVLLTGLPFSIIEGIVPGVTVWNTQGASNPYSWALRGTGAATMNLYRAEDSTLGWDHSPGAYLDSSDGPYISISLSYLG